MMQSHTYLVYLWNKCFEMLVFLSPLLISKCSPKFCVTSSTFVHFPKIPFSISWTKQACCCDFKKFTSISKLNENLTCNIMKCSMWSSRNTTHFIWLPFPARGKARWDDSPHTRPKTVGSIKCGHRQALSINEKRQTLRTIRWNRQKTRPDPRTVHPRGQRNRQERWCVHFQDSTGICRLQQRLLKGKSVSSITNARLTLSS